MSHTTLIELPSGKLVPYASEQTKRKPSRGAVVHIRCWADQKAAWQLAASSAGMTLSEWICRKLG